MKKSKLVIEIKRSLIYLLVFVSILQGKKGSILNESFEATTWPPEGWEVIRPGSFNDGWVRQGWGAHSGSYCGYIQGDNWGYLVTPMLDFTGEENTVLSFWISQNSWEPENFKIMWSEDKSNWNLLSEISVINGGYNNFEFDLDSLDTFAYIAFLKEPDMNAIWHIDDVSGPEIFESTNDLYVGEMSYVSSDLDYIYEGETIQINTDIVNLGSVNFENIKVYLLKEESKVDSVTIDYLTSGTSFQHQFSWEVTHSELSSYVNVGTLIDINDDNLVNNLKKIKVPVFTNTQIAEGFEGELFPPHGWDIQSVWIFPDSWYSQEITVFGFIGDYMATSFHDDQGRIITPMLTIDENDSISFISRNNFDPPQPFIIQYSEDKVNWNDFETIMIDGEVKKYSISLSSIQGEYYLGFYKDFFGVVKLDHVIGPEIKQDVNDLQLLSIEYDKTIQIMPNDNLLITLKVLNNGFEVCNGSAMEIKIDDEVVEIIEINNIVPSEIKEYTFNWNTPDVIRQSFNIEAVLSDDFFNDNNAKSDIIDVEGDRYILEDFEAGGFPPNGWTTDSNSWFLQDIASGVYSGIMCAVSSSLPTDASPLITPKLEISYGDKLTLYARNYYWQSPYLKIKYSEDGVNWTEITDFIPNHLFSRFETDLDLEGNYYIGFFRGGSGTLFIDHIIIPKPEEVGINNEKNIPDEIKLSQNYPNPFNSQTIINFSIPQDSPVELLLYNSNGEFLQSITNGFFVKGNHVINYKADNLSSGVYYYRMKTTKQDYLKKMIYLK
ncbi:MAG: choice-of-anchor J domain-containing protein [Candidatus Delongbacteria bacterium]|nr:choice-of-anchor J domain-containing protein [Candidatus Delongbacteria bacterium]MBN2835965.1 choice-of-anchor J domain-containing protein [Candidatus Delongbacteria bacterium]